MKEDAEVDWNKPLVTALKGLPVKIQEWEESCKWLKVGAGIYMYNNDGTCVSGGGMRVFNSTDDDEDFKIHMPETYKPSTRFVP